MTEKITITVGTTEYESIAEAARAYSLPPNVVSRRLRRGWSIEEALGIKHRRNARYGSRLVVLGKSYSSASELARAYGLNAHTVNWRLRNDWTPEQAVEVDPPPEEAKGPKKISVNGVQYRSLMAAARAFKFNPDMVKSRVQLGWTVEQAFGLEEPPAHPGAKPVVIEGIRYRSIAKACEAHGISYKTVESRVRLGWTIEQAIGVEPPPDGANMAKPTVLEGKEYPSVAAAARAYNLHDGLIKGRLGLGWTKKQAFGIDPPPKHIRQRTKKKGGVIYRIRNKKNGILYFGQTSINPKQRWYQHQLDALSGSDTKLHQAMAEVGLNSFEFEVVDEADNGEKLDILEAEYIFYFDTIEHGYNSYQPPLTSSGEAGSIRLGKPKPLVVDEKLPVSKQRLAYKKEGGIKRYAKLSAADKIHIGRRFKPFVDARAFVRQLGLQSYSEWKKFCVGELEGVLPKPNDIPTNPAEVYKTDGWKGLGDWLGTGTVATWQREYLAHSEAKAFVHKLGLSRVREWNEYCRGEKTELPPLPANIPKAPDKHYKGKGWNGMGDWLGTNRKAYGATTYRSFDDARAFSRTLRLGGYPDWISYCKGEKTELPAKPMDIPATPDRIYRDLGWMGYPDWLGYAPKKKRRKKV